MRAAQAPFSSRVLIKGERHISVIYWCSQINMVKIPVRAHFQPNDSKVLFERLAAKAACSSRLRRHAPGERHQTVRLRY